MSTAEREAWLDAQTRSHAFTARAIADAYGAASLPDTCHD